MNKILLTLSRILLVYFVIEAMSALSLAAMNNVVHSHYFSASIDRHFSDIDKNYLETFLTKHYHPVLGWDNKPHSVEQKVNCRGESWIATYDSDGARKTPEKFDTTVIAAYGDSFTKGAEVNNDQTWPFLLAKDIQKGVANYGVGGYGPYQALLKLKSHINENRVYPITILAIYAIDIWRPVNLFRPFLNKGAKGKLNFKPAIRCEEGGKCITFDNPLRSSLQTIEQAREVARVARKWDYWAHYKPVIEYPYSLNLAKLARYIITESVLYDEEYRFWQIPEGIAVMQFIVSDFYDSVKKVGSIPVIVFIPSNESLRENKIPSYSVFKQQISTDYPDLLIMDVFDNDYEKEKFGLKPFNCHASEYGNGIIARMVRTNLQRILPIISVPEVNIPRQSRGL